MNSQEAPKEYSPEEIAEIEKNRTLSDAGLLTRGAEYIINEKNEKELELTKKQIERLKFPDLKEIEPTKELLERFPKSKFSSKKFYLFRSYYSQTFNKKMVTVFVEGSKQPHHFAAHFFKLD
jgi:hypothetical protein